MTFGIKREVVRQEQVQSGKNHIYIYQSILIIMIRVKSTKEGQIHYIRIRNKQAKGKILLGRSSRVIKRGHCIRQYLPEMDTENMERCNQTLRKYTYVNLEADNHIVGHEKRCVLRV